MNVADLFADWDTIEEHPAGVTVFSKQEPADTLYVVLHGEVQLSIGDQPIEVATAGGVIGELALLDDALAGITATTRTHARLARLDRNQMHAQLKGNSEFSFHMLSALANRLRTVDGIIAVRPGSSDGV